MHHRIWCCQGVGEAGNEEDEEDDDKAAALRKLAKGAPEDLSERAKRLAPLTPCFWNRGLVPASWTRFEDPTEEFSRTAGGVGDDWRTKRATQRLYTDGSGDFPDKRIRRTGWSVVALKDAAGDDDQSGDESSGPETPRPLQNQPGAEQKEQKEKCQLGDGVPRDPPGQLFEVGRPQGEGANCALHSCGGLTAEEQGHKLERDAGFDNPDLFLEESGAEEDEPWNAPPEMRGNDASPPLSPLDRSPVEDGQRGEMHGETAEDHGVAKAWYGSLAGRQSVARAELRACVEAVRLLRPETKGIIFTDCRFVSNGFAKKWFEKPRGRHRDLWAQLGEAMKGRRAETRVKWVKAHVTVEDLLDTKTKRHMVEGNAAADLFAKKASKEASLGPAAQHQVNQIDRDARHVHLQIVKACKASLQNAAEKTDKPAKIKASQVKKAEEESGHKMTKLKSRKFQCSRCNLIAPKGGLLRWLRSGPCTDGGRLSKSSFADAPTCFQEPAKVAVGNSSSTAHPSHSMAANHGFLWCWNCGGYGAERSRSRTTLLAKPCRNGFSEAGKIVIKRVLKDKTPRSTKRKTLTRVKEDIGEL